MRKDQADERKPQEKKVKADKKKKEQTAADQKLTPSKPSAEKKKRLNDLSVESDPKHSHQFIKASSDKKKQDRNYQLLIADCHEQVKFLNQVPLPVLEQSLAHFRDNVFFPSERRKIPHLIY